MEKTMRDDLYVSVVVPIYCNAYRGRRRISTIE